jgi:hypothetical protein
MPYNTDIHFMLAADSLVSLLYLLQELEGNLGEDQFLPGSNLSVNTE